MSRFARMAVEDWLKGARGKAAEADALDRANKARRDAAGEHPQSVILNPADIRGSYDAARLLKTTLGGAMRDITAQDLAAFQQNIKTAQQQFSKGITARQVIDLSVSKPLRYGGKVWAGKSDIDKARQEIRHALPLSLHSGTMRIITNAGPDYGNKRHHVTVKFLSYGAAAAAGHASPRKMALWLRNQPLAFDCDCGRHQYWFRFIATIGGFNAGRPENGFPKIRNPQVHGVACKHVLRAMSEIDQGAAGIVGMLTTAIEKAATNTDGSTKAQVRAKHKDLETKAKAQGKEAIQSSDDKKAAREAAKTRKAAREAVAGVVRPPKPSGAQRRIDQAIKAGLLTEAQVSGMRVLGLNDDMIAKITRA